MNTAEVVADRIARVREAVAAAGSPARIVAVTKGFGPEAIGAAAAAGVMDIGESYADEMLSKLDGAASELRWHFIGRLQSNKVRRLGTSVALWHSIDRPRLIAEVAARVPGAAVLVQVDTTGEATKGGCAIDDVSRLVHEARVAGLAVRGLMTIGPTGGDERSVGAAFGELARLAESEGLTELSMGMSGDWRIALDQGSTLLRLGTALFGDRPRG